jgi:signal transduction histidine kinase
MAARLRTDEAALREKVDALEAATRRLTETQAHLVRSERLASVGRLAAGLAHEIGNPIAAIMGLQEMMLDGGLTPEEQRDFLLRMKKETERIHKVLRDLLDFARPEREAAPSSTSAVRANVAKVAGDVLALLAPQKSMKGIEIISKVDDTHEVRISPSRLTQVLLNLGLNAGDAMKNKEGRIVFESERTDDVIAITITDNGPGIAEDVRAKLFEPFVTTKEPGEGTGLGLAVCRGIVESAGGTIELDPTYASGARFVVTLPRA